MIPKMKNLRVAAPEKYSSEDDIKICDTWITGLLWWYQVHNVTGSTKYSVRVDLCGTTLKGTTSAWYSDEVEAWNWPNGHWVFKDLVCTMYKRFIHEVMAQNAAVKFDHTLYSKLKGALAFYNDLKQYPGHMVISPDKYSMKNKFLKGLPIDMIDHLLKTRWVTTKHTPFKVILKEVKAMECSTQSFNLYKKEQQSCPSNNDMEQSGDNNNTDLPTQTC